MSDYKVQYSMNDQWEVVTWIRDEEDGGIIDRERHHTGSLADCEAWIRLKEGGYLEG